MNELEERLQERLERLEAGEPLADCLTGLPTEEIELLTLAAMLREEPYPVPNGETSVSQRASLQRMVQDSSSPTSPWAGLTVKLATWWQQQTADARRGIVTATAVAVIMLIPVIFGGLFRPDDVLLPEDTIVVEASGAQSVTQLPAPDAAAVPETAPAESAPVVDESGEAVYIPIVSFPLDRRPETAVLGDIHGFVEMQDETGEWTAVSQVTSLAAGKRLRTSAFSRASLTFFDGSQTDLGPNSELSLDVVDAQLAADGLRTVIMTQWSGESEHHVQFRGDSGSRYEVKSPHGSGIARGTVFQVQVTADARTLYTVTEGRVDVTSADSTVSVTPGKVSTIMADEPPSPPTFFVIGEGEVAQIGTEWIVGGQTFLADDQTIIVGDPQVGDWVRVEGHLLSDGARLADRISLLNRTPVNRFSITGQVSTIGTEAWTVAGQMIAVDAMTTIDAAISQGDIVRVDGLIQSDGRLLAERIRLVAVDAGLPFEFTGIVQSMTPTTWLVSGVTITIDEATEIKGEIAVGNVVKVEGYIAGDGIWLAHEIKLAEAAESKFEISGRVVTIAPWIVAGIAFETDGQTKIAADIALGDLVKVEGRILADGTWLAAEIKLLTEEDHLSFEFYGTVGSIDPWVVSGIALPVTVETAVDPGIAVGDLVKVTVTILPDGSWLVEEIVLVNSAGDDAGCFSVTAVVLSHSDDQLTVDDWPVFQLGDTIELDGQIQSGSIITIYACVDDTGLLVILDIIIMYTPDPADTPSPPSPDDDGDGAKVTLCHKPDSKNPHAITVAQSAVQAHLNHGDTLGACP